MEIILLFTAHRDQYSRFTKDSILYHNKINLLNNKKNTHTKVNYSHSPIHQYEETKNQYTGHDVNRDYHARKFQHTTSQPV